jgi:DNA-binding MarR family transcriptional regulator
VIAEIASSGLSQQALARTLAILPSRLVILVDELQERGLVERRDHPEDRRVYALYVTAKGEQAMMAIGQIARAHNDALCAALSQEERALLVDFLARIADEQGLTPGVHPGFKQLGPEGRAGEKRGPKSPSASGKRPKGRRSARLHGIHTRTR